MITKTMKKRVLLTAVLAVAGAGVFVSAGLPASADDGTPPSDQGIVPVRIDGNPTCGSLSGLLELRVDPVVSGDYVVPGIGTITVVANADKSLDWSSTFGIDLVFVKGGSAGNSYVYDPPEEDFGDGGLFAPDTNNSNDPAGLSHISFCYDIELNVTKTAVTSFDRDWDWSIVKSVDPSLLNLHQGQTGSVEWTVAVTKTGPQDSNFAVSGAITIQNPHPTEAATVTGVTDVITGGINASVVCPSAFPFSVPAGGTVVCTYSSALPDATARTNTATVTTSGAVGGDSGTAAVAFSATPTNETDASINVEDTVSGNLGAFTGSDTVSYIQQFTCDADEGSHSNTATIPPTSDQGEQNSTATTEVVCHDLTVTKTANTTHRETFDWDVVKTSTAPGDLTLQLGQVYPVTFTVTATAVSSFDLHAVAGVITVTNPAPIPVDLISVNDTISGGINAAVDCGAAVFPYTLAPGATLNCAYLAALPDGTDRINTATATTEFGAQYSGSALVSFGAVGLTQVNRCVSILDTQHPLLASLFDTNNDGLVCADEIGSRSYTLNLTADVCGPTVYTNVVSLSTGESSTVTINTNVPCDVGCTLTIGYWKTHSIYGPAKKADPGWYLIGDVDGDGVSEGPDETFFSSGKTWLQVFNTAPAGNPYYVLAQQYMGAVLNIANGASSTPAVDAAIAAATTFFQTTTPAQAAGLKGAAKNAIITLAGTLASYNEGAIGPGHCDESPVL